MTDATLIEPTAEERRNGWTAETLTAYVHDRAREQRLDADWTGTRRSSPPVRCDNDYAPLRRWRR